MKHKEWIFAVGAVALLSGPAVAQTVRSETVTRTTHVTAGGNSGASYRHRTVRHSRYRPRHVAHYRSTRVAPAGGYSRTTTETRTTTYDHPERYDYNRPDPRYGSYYADRYYRDDPQYQERVVQPNERIYEGENGQYYCRRSDGTTGLVIGGLAGGALGNALTKGGSKVLGTLLGGAAGAAVGTSIDRNNVRCR
jgi:hypothetical protein